MHTTVNFLTLYPLKSVTEKFFWRIYFTYTAIAALEGLYYDKKREFIKAF